MRRFGVVGQEKGERGEWYLATQIAVGILIAAAVIFAGFHLYLYFAARAAAVVVQEAAQQFEQEVQAQAVARRTEEQRRAALEMHQREDRARQAQLAVDQARAKQAAAAAKRAAWLQFFKPPKKCESPPDWDTQVECGNAHMKARDEFEERWARGAI